MRATGRIRAATRAGAIGAGAIAVSAIVGVAPALAAGTRPCYANQFVGDAGPGSTSFASSGFQPFPASEFDPAGPSNASYGAGRVQWAARGSVLGANTGATDGSMSGSLTATFLFANGKSAVFTSRCVAEVQTDAATGNPNNQGDAEMETEGTIVGFPGIRGPAPAVASISISNGDNDVYNINFGVELGTTCHEDGLGDPNQEFGGIFAPATGGTSRTTVQNKGAGRISAPAGLSPEDCTPI